MVAEATELPVRNERDCVELMQRGIAARAVSATAMNAGSSRSHCVVYLVVERAFPDGRTEFGKLCLVVGGSAAAGPFTGAAAAAACKPIRGGAGAAAHARAGLLFACIHDTTAVSHPDGTMLGMWQTACCSD